MSVDRLYIEQFLDRPAQQVGEAVITRLSGVYAGAFEGSPWNEYTVDPVTGRFFGRDTNPGELSPDGSDSVLELAYPPEPTATYIKGELERPDAALLLVRDRELDGDEVVGFSWGFSYDSPEGFAASKYKTDEMQIRIASLLRREGIDGRLWYLSESGILDDPQYRGRGLSREFHERRLEIARTLGLPAVQRTMNPGPMYRSSIKTMRQIFGPTAKVDPATGQLGEIDGNVNGVDSENEARVLFVSR